MNDKPQAAAAGKSWLSAHPLVVIATLLAVCLGPFINQAEQTDDTLFVWTGQWIQRHPADFFGFKVNWWGSTIPMWVANYNPPLLPYLLAGVATLFGWHEMVLHLRPHSVCARRTAAAGILHRESFFPAPISIAARQSAGGQGRRVAGVSAHNLRLG
jgi:hypothetical protein